MIRENLEVVRTRIACACRAAGREAAAVTLCAVSKTKPVEDIQQAMEAGQHVFGENYVQEIVKKHQQLGNAVEWHMIGHLQRNKVKHIIDKVRLIHSVDSIALAQEIEKQAGRHGLRMDILLEVNIAEEASKWGFLAGQVPAAAEAVSQLPHVHLCGLMTSAPYTENPESNRGYFRRLRALYDALSAQKLPGVDMQVLSMGMTGDYAVAVEEGATMVRVGTGIFGAREYPATLKDDSQAAGRGKA